MNPQAIVFQGSARSQGDTHTMVQHLLSLAPAAYVDLLDYQIGQFDYTHANRTDDFLPLIRQAIARHNVFVLATPVYWYTMSGEMKKFVDRFSDLLKIEKDVGRQLRGKHLAVLSVASEDHLKPGFHMPFREMANYLGMHYAGDVHGWLQEGALPEVVKQRLTTFAEGLALAQQK